MSLRLLPLLSLLLSLSLLTAACSKNSRDPDNATQPTSGPTATVKAGASNGSSGSPTPSDDNPTAPAGISEADLVVTLLRAEDLGPGWSPAGSESVGKGSLQTSTGGNGYCGLAGGEFEALDGYVAAAWTAYERSESQAFASHQLVSYAEDDAQAAFARYVEVLRSCERWSQARPDGGVWNWVVRDVASGDIQHESVVVELEITSGGRPLGQARIVVWRRASVVSRVTFLALAPGDGSETFPNEALTFLRNRLRATVNRQ